MRASTRCAKRSLDIVLATTGLLLGLPLLPVIAVAIKLGSRGPVFHRAVRLGVQRRAGGTRANGGHRVHDGGGRYFVQRRFRVLAATEASHPAYGEHPRITRVGRVLRRTGLEGWPQLWSVLSGRMTLVGPRPVTPECIERMEAAGLAARVPLRRMPPGIFGLTQLAWDPAATFHANLCERLVFDRHYLRLLEASAPLSALWLDLCLVGACLLRRVRSGQPAGHDVIRVSHPRRFRQIDLGGRELAESRPSRLGSEVVDDGEAITAWWYPPRRRAVDLPAPDGNLVASLSDGVGRKAPGVLVLTKVLASAGRDGVDEITVELPRGLHHLHAVCAHLEPVWTALAARASDPHFATTMTVLLVEGLATTARLRPAAGTGFAAALRAEVRISDTQVRLALSEVQDDDPVATLDPTYQETGEALPA